MDQKRNQYFLELLRKIYVNLPAYPNKALKEEIERVIKQLRGI
jgi:hypothetical protein